MSSSRSRSVSRTRVVKLTDLFPSGESLDPVALLDDVLPHINNLDIPLAVKISDSTNTVFFLLSTFISKEYEVIDDVVKLGFQRLKVKELKVNISFDISIVDDVPQSNKAS